MKKFLLLTFALFLICPQLASAQTQRNPCYYVDAANTHCNPVGVATPLPVTVASGIPSGATQITTSNTGTTAAVASTLAAVAGKTTYICGYIINANATAGTSGQAAITGTITGLLSELQSVATAPAVASNSTNFGSCIAASAPNTPIVVTSIAAGAGGNTSVNAWGYQQ